MQTYLILSAHNSFWLLWTATFLTLAAFILPSAIKEQYHQWRIKWEFNYYRNREQYFIDLKKGKRFPKNKADVRRIAGMNQNEFQEWLVSLWRGSDLFYQWRLGKYWQNRQNKQFEIHSDATHSPTGQKMDEIEFFT